jgi:hypothetical protein
MVRRYTICGGWCPGRGGIMDRRAGGALVGGWPVGGGFSVFCARKAPGQNASTSAAPAASRIIRFFIFVAPISSPEI